MFRVNLIQPLGLAGFLLIAVNAEIFQNDSLVKTILLFRHGMRAPIKPMYFSDALDDNMKYWPEGYGKLVQNGKEQMFHLGMRLHAYYDKLVDVQPKNGVSSKHLQVVTTSVHRCYESALHLLAGFFSSSFNWTWSEAVEKQPIPILYGSPDRTDIISNRAACPRFHEFLDRALPDFDRADIRYIRHYLMNHTTQLNLTNIIDVFMFIDYVKIGTSMNLETPSWMTTEYREKLDQFFSDSFHFLSETVDMVRLLSGPLIEDITNRIREVIYSEPTNSKMYIYAGHDASLHALAKVLGHHLDFAPHFGASLIFEVHRMSSTDYRIRLLYNADYSFDFVEVWRLPDCEEFCPVGKFMQAVEKFFVKDYARECSLA